MTRSLCRFCCILAPLTARLSQPFGFRIVTSPATYSSRPRDDDDEDEVKDFDDDDDDDDDEAIPEDKIRGTRSIELYLSVFCNRRCLEDKGIVVTSLINPKDSMNSRISKSRDDIDIMFITAYSNQIVSPIPGLTSLLAFLFFSWSGFLSDRPSRRYS